MGLKKPAPIPAKTPTLSCGWGFPRVQVRVALENPRVACDNPYVPCYCYPARSLLLCYVALVWDSGYGRPMGLHGGYEVGIVLCRLRLRALSQPSRAVGSRDHHKPSLRPVTAHSSGFKYQKPEAAAQADGFL